MSEQSYKIICLSLALLYALVRAPYQWQYRAREKRLRVSQLRESILVTVVAVCWWGVSALYVFTDVLSAAAICVSDWIRLSGALTMLLGILFFWRVHHYLGRHWSPVLEMGHGHELVEGGPYKRIRHPMYTAIWISILGQSILCANWALAISSSASFLVLCLLRIPDEEAMLSRELGDPYLRYISRTGRLFPRLRVPSELP